MRLLHPGHDDARACFVAEKAAGERCRDSSLARAPSLPLRHAYADFTRDPPGAFADDGCASRRPQMKGEAVILSRRSVLTGSGALIVNFSRSEERRVGKSREID